MTPPHYVFACTHRHRVAVDPARFWAPARCPSCKSPVDPFRTGRLKQWIRGSAPRSRLRIGRFVLTPLDGLGWLLVLCMLLVALAYRAFGDRTWWGTALIYTGRWPWLLPVAALALLALAWRRRALVPIGLAALVVMGPVMGGTLSTAPLWHEKAKVRILTFNVEGGKVVSPRLKELLAATRPDIAGFEECGQTMRDALAGLEGWAAVDTASTTCFLSRYPLRAPPVRMAARDLQAAGGSAVVSRYEVLAPVGTVTVFVLHLETPRHGVQHLLSDPVNAPRLIDANNLLRDTESRVVRRWIDSTAPPRVVLGDFNLPVESVVWQRYWGDLTDAFDAAGNGWGFTKLNGWIEVRIDHVLLDPQLKAVGAHVGDDWGSDHLPFIAEVVRR
jgi:endonuclease/exonuclease/phosphatase (EEP) superfamily protein YafD